MKKNLALCVAACALASLTACNESVSLTGTDCTHGDLRCEADNVEICDNGYWEINAYCNGSSVCNATTLTCEEATTDCTDGDKRCEANNVEICADDAWTIETQCSSSESCNATTYVCDEVTADCTDGDRRCEANNVEICTDKAWTIETTCDNSEYCNNEDYTCQTGCEENTKRCTDNAIEICNDDAWTVETTCEATQVCNATTYVCDEVTADCTDGDKRCESNNVEVCMNGTWKVETTCDNSEYCNATTFVCEATCEEGTTQCTDDGKLETCHMNIWDITDCGIGQICLSGKKVCEDKVCDEGSVVCNDTNDAILTCTDNKLVKTACAGDTAICNAGACVACLDGDKRCENNAVEACILNVWTIQKACGDLVCDSDTYACKAAPCVAGTQRCNGKNIEICNATGSYEISDSCDNYCLEGKGDTASCIDCKSNTDCTAPDKPVCHSDNSCVACVANNEHKCHNGYILSCNTYGKWDELAEACDAGQECLPGGTACTPIVGYCFGNADCSADPRHPVCLMDSHRCGCASGNSICKITGGIGYYEVCTNGQWQASVKCDASTPLCNTAGTTCVECRGDGDCSDTNKCDMITGKCKASPACTNGQITCNDQEALTCSGDKWLGQTCSTLCIDGLGCRVCLPSTTKCEDKKLLTCTAAGFWDSGVSCPSDQECLAVNTVCTDKPCTNGQTKCDGNKYMACVSNTWETTSTCSGSTPLCDAAKACIQCSNNSHCTSGSANMCDTTTNTCVICINGSNKCEGNNFMTCVNKNWTLTTTCSGATPACDESNACVECAKSSDCTDPLYPSCSSNTCLCAAGQSICKVEDGVAKQSRCAGVWGWSEYEPCAANKPVCNTAGTSCVECTNNSHCQFGTCDTATNTCKDACEDYTFVCEGLIPWLCMDNKWTTTGPCPDACVEGLEMGCRECMPNTKKCKDNMIVTCSEWGHWPAGQPCPNGQQCRDGASACTNN